MDIQWLIDEVNTNLNKKEDELADLNYGEPFLLVELADNSIDEYMIYGYIVNKFDENIPFEDAEARFDDLIDEVSTELEFEIDTDYTISLGRDDDNNYGVLVSK